MSNLIPAAGYIRMSDHSQTESPKQQRPEIIKLAKQHGCRIVAWYQDDGITGDSIEKRPQFSKMLADAERGEFEVILCWDQDRFGRFDSITAGAVIHPLRQAGVRLVTLAQGAIDWNDFAGRMMYAIQQEGKYQFLVDLSRNVLRGQIATAERGDWQASPPLGYDRQYFDAQGNEVNLVPHGEKFIAPKEWRCRLAVSRDGAMVELIRWMFDEFAWKQNSLCGIARELNQRGFRSARGMLWTSISVKRVLRNPAYVGHSVFGRISQGKYHYVDGDGEIETKNDKPVEGGAVIVENTHEALIEPRTFAAVQDKIRHRAEAVVRVTSSSYPLSSGLLRCGHCDGNMGGHFAKSLNRRNYICCAAGKGCGHQSIPAEVIEKFVVGLVREQILTDDNLDRIRADIVTTLKQRKPRRSTATKAIKTSLTKLEAKIKKGTERLLLVDDDAAQDASLLLTEWREERASLKAQLDAAGHDGGVSPLKPEQQAERHVMALMALREGLASADPARLRYVFQEIFAEVRLWWTTRRPGKQRPGARNRYRFLEGLALLKQDTTNPLLHPSS